MSITDEVCKYVLLISTEKVTQSVRGKQVKPRPNGVTLWRLLIELRMALRFVDDS